jgi:putative pyruvate formate lyase activating enzyme
MIIDSLRRLGYNPSFVYNTNGYDTEESIQGLKEYIDIYLPDYKYSYENLGRELSDAPEYPEVALNALKEMYRQAGHELRPDGNGYATSGMIIRHLVLPGHVENSINVLRNIAGYLSNNISISLMSQYYPANKVSGHPQLGRTLRYGEYDRVVKELERLGFTNGWVQHLESHENYRPDFMKENPFE